MHIDIVAALNATIFMFYGLNFFVLGMVLIGIGELKDAGPIFLFAGAVNGIIALVVFITSLAAGAGETLIIAFLVLVFAITWLAAGTVGILGADVKPLGSLGIFFGLAMVPFAVFLIQDGGAEVAGRLWLTVNVISWIWVFATLPLAFIFNVISARVAGWTFLVTAFYTLWIPSAILLAGFTLP